MPLTRAALDTTGFLSTTACFRYRSICPNSPPSVILQSTLMAFARYKSVLLFISFISELVTMITCHKQFKCQFPRIIQPLSWCVTKLCSRWVKSTSSLDGEISLITKYTIRRKPMSLDWNSLVTAKKTSVASICSPGEEEQKENLINHWSTLIELQKAAASAHDDMKESKMQVRLP